MQKKTGLRRLKASPLSSPIHYLYLLPAAILILIFIIYPIGDLIRLSFVKWNGLGKQTFVGVKNYVNTLKSSDFWFSMKITLIWMLMSVFILQTVGVFLAVIVERFVRTRALSNTLRTIFFMPMMMSWVAIGLLWSLIYNANMGLITGLLTSFGFVDPANPPNFLGSSSTALFAAFVPVIWQWGGFGMILTSGAMLRIPRELYEASALDGASRVRQFFHITLPLIMPTVFTGMTINMIGAFKGFDMIYAMTGGGPANYTRLTSLYIYNLAFTQNKYGSAAAASVILMLVVVIFTVFFNKIGRLIDEKYSM